MLSIAAIGNCPGSWGIGGRGGEVGECVGAGGGWGGGYGREGSIAMGVGLI